MSKAVRVSSSGSTGTWFTLPGNKGDISNQAGEIDDTVFGQDFKSSQTGLIGCTISADGMYKGFAGYVAKLKKAGTTTAFTGEAMTLVSGKTYKITNPVKNVWDRTATFVVKDNAVDHTTDVLSIDFLFGRVTFKSAYTPTGPVTVDGKYLPMATVGRANGFTLTQTAAQIDNTDFDTAQSNNGFRVNGYGLKTVSLALQGIYDDANAFLPLLEARSEMVIEINPDGNSKSVARGWFKCLMEGSSGNVGALEQETVNFGLSVPAQQSGAATDINTPFEWIHDSSTTLNTAVQMAISAWANKTSLFVAYVPDGMAGVQAPCIITDVTLTGGLEVMNSFAIKAMATSQLVAYTP